MFKVGQKVKIVSFEQPDISEEDEECIETPNVGETGVVSKVECNRDFPYKVHLEDGESRMFCKEELVLMREPGEQLLFKFMEGC